MLIKLIIETIGKDTYIGGYQAAVGKEAIELPVELESESDWRDAYGNYRWALVDGKPVPAAIAPSAQQISDKVDFDRAAKLLPMLGVLLVKAIKGTSGPAQSWAMFDAAVRSLLNGG